MDKAYASALWVALQKGMDPKEAVRSLHDSLARRGRASLLPQIGRSFERIAMREMQKKRSQLVVADARHEKNARKESGGKDAELVVDASLIGGWRLEDKETLKDASWKSALLSIYGTVTNQ